MEFGLLQFGGTLTGEGDLAVLHDGFARDGEGLAGVAMAVDEAADLGWGPARGMTVGHFDSDAHLLLVARDAVEGFLIAVEHVVDVIGTVDEEDGDAAVGQVVGGVVAPDPFGAVVAELVDGGLLHGLALMEEAAAIDRYGSFETVIDRGDDAGGVAAPTDASDGGPVRVHARETADEGMRADD